MHGITCTLSVFLIVLLPNFCSAAQRILVVHSYHESQRGHVVVMTEGILEALEGTDKEIKFFHMDTKRKNSEEWKRAAGQRAKELVEDFNPHLVITMDDNAQEYFGKDLAGRDGAPMVVFAGVNADPKKYGYPAKNVTGVLERTNIVESIEFLQKIVPGVNRLLILTDKSPTTDSFITYAKSLSLPGNIVAYEQPGTFDQFKDILKRYHDKVDAIGLYTLRTIARSNTDPQKVSEKELVEYINAKHPLPTVAFFDTAAKAGALCGITVSMKEQGYAAGVLAKEILSGTAPQDCEIEPTSKGRIQLNLQTAERLGIQIKHLYIKRADVLVR